MSKSRFDQAVCPVFQQTEKAHGIRCHDLDLVALDYEGVLRCLQRLPELVRGSATVVGQGVTGDAGEVDVRVVPALVADGIAELGGDLPLEVRPPEQPVLGLALRTRVGGAAARDSRLRPLMPPSAHLRAGR